MPSSATADLTATGYCTLSKPTTDTVTVAHIAGTYAGAQFKFEGTMDSTNWFPIAAAAYDTGAIVTGTIAPANNLEAAWKLPTEGLSSVRINLTAYTSGTVSLKLYSAAYAERINFNYVNGGTYSSVTLSGTTTASGPVDHTDIGTVAATGSVQGDAASLTNETTYVSAADGTKGVVLPAATAGKRRYVYNTHATSGLKIYPASGDDINDGSADAAVTIEGKTLAIFHALDSDTWAALYTVNT